MSIQTSTRAETSAASIISPIWLEVQRWLLHIGAFVLPLVVVFDAFDKYVLPKLLVARVFAIAMLVVLLVRGVMTGRWTWRRTALDIPLLLFVASTALSTLFAVNRNIALFGMYIRGEGLLTILTYAGIFWLAVQLIPSRQDARDLGRTMLVSACIVTVIAVYLANIRFGAGPDTTIGPYVRAFGSVGSPVELGTYLAMLLPFALAEVIDGKSLEHRLLPGAGLIILTTGLLLTFTRAAWAAAVVGIVLVVFIRRPARQVVLAGAAVILVVVGITVATGRIGGSSSIVQALGSRATSTATLSEGSVAWRLQLWKDSIHLLAARPLVGSGPDSFGLVYPSVQSLSTPGIDKAHNDLLQVAVTNGLLGILAYYLLVAAIVVQLWRQRRIRWVAAMFAGMIAYFVALQAEFSWIPAALPFWFFAGVGFYAATDSTETARPAAGNALWQRVALTVGIVAAGFVLTYFAVVPDLYADRIFAQAVKDTGRGARDSARQEVAWSRELNPHQSVYAVAAGDLAINMQFGYRPGPQADLNAARDAYQDAVQLGTTDPDAYRGLAVADNALGDRRDALAAAQRAVQLDRSDQGSVAVLQMIQNNQ